MIFTRRVRANPTITGTRYNIDGSPVLSDFTITPVGSRQTYTATPDANGYFALNVPALDTPLQWRTELTPLGRLTRRLTGWPRVEGT